MDTPRRKHLRNYVDEMECDSACKQVINECIDVLGQKINKELIVYRGQGHSQEIRLKRSNNTPYLWFSASTNMSIAKDEFSNLSKKDIQCCLFKIHLQPRTSVLFVNEHIETRHKYEDEVLVQVNNAQFYSDSLLKTPGFKDLGDGIYETWFAEKIKSPKKPKQKINLRKIVNEGIDRDDLEFIDDIDDLKITLKQYVGKLSEKEWEQILTYANELKE